MDDEYTCWEGNKFVVVSDVDESEDRRGDGVTRSITVCDDERPFSTSLQFPYFGAKNKNIVYMCSFEKKIVSW